MTSIDARALAVCPSLAMQPGFASGFRYTPAERPLPDDAVKAVGAQSYYHDLKPDPPPPEPLTAMEIVQRVIEQTEAGEAQRVIELACHLADTTPEVVASGRRGVCASKARAAIVYVLRTRERWSYPRIGNALGVNHSTVITAYRRVEKGAA